MISTLFLTIIVESIPVSLSSLRGKKPVRSILLTSVSGNLVTQSLLWVVLSLFFHSYLTTLLIAEVFIWLLEGLLFYSVTANGLRFREALLLSLGINVLSFSLGWFLPV